MDLNLRRAYNFDYDIDDRSNVEDHLKKYPPVVKIAYTFSL